MDPIRSPDLTVWESVTDRVYARLPRNIRIDSLYSSRDNNFITSDISLKAYSLFMISLLFTIAQEVAQFESYCCKNCLL